MIRRAQERGEIKPGDTLIEPTSGNTGIALAMCAAMMGYRMILVMPEHLSVERRQTMAAFGAEFVLTPKEGGMEMARDIAEKCATRAEGVILDQFANPDNPLVALRRHGPRDLARYRRQGHSFREQHGNDRHHHGRFALSEGAQPARSRSSAASRPKARRYPASANGPKPMCRGSATGAASIA